MSLPLELIVPLPHDIPIARGVHSTSTPHGVRVTINMTAQEHQLITDALRILGGGISISSYLRQLGTSAAKQLMLHDKETQDNLRSLGEQFLRDNS